MTERYFVASRIAGPAATLAAAEAHHLAHVMRAKPGDRVVLFDGTGGEYIAEVARVERSTVQLAVLSHDPVERALGVAITVACSLPKGDRQRWLIEKLTELGCTSVVPLSSDRGVAQPTAEALERLRRTVIEASKQCGRNRLMQIAAPRIARDFFAQPSAGACRLIAHPEAAGSLRDVLSERASPQNAPVDYVLAIGPEGGFTDDEAQLATGAGWTAVNLGAPILRVETAAVALAAAVALMR